MNELGEEIREVVELLPLLREADNKGDRLKLFTRAYSEF
jgi:hypothetical protein